MNRLVTIIALVVTSLPMMTVAAQKQLTILHSNDTHSCILPLNKNLADTVVAGRGGFMRRIALLKEERQKDPDLLYFDSGDFSQGSTTASPRRSRRATPPSCTRSRRIRRSPPA